MKFNIFGYVYFMHRSPQSTRFQRRSAPQSADEALGNILSWTFISPCASGWCYRFNTGDLPVPNERLIDYDDNDLTYAAMSYANVLAGVITDIDHRNDQDDRYAWTSGGLFLVDVLAGTPSALGFLHTIQEAFDFLARDTDESSLALLTFSDGEVTPDLQRLRTDGWIVDTRTEFYPKVSVYRKLLPLILPSHVN